MVGRSTFGPAAGLAGEVGAAIGAVEVGLWEPGGGDW